jgi:methionine synthase II (cobalamin-independent)
MATSDVWSARADHVGSLLRPDRLIAARDKANAGQMEAVRHAQLYSKLANPKFSIMHA